ncbi:hypothetical protein NW752_010892 [Fusarium irregulare]|uniref:Uncharacterized protein n=1 Tax=Fusarium irregulare TaxID=2494466 RepID=A0A9W8U4L8_9HYPO|nr:hypothetical protein NW766_011883 [Fusarium irregulare]KAJ4006244.1 hypothetical protein NW752_010892 [Fusarium irregulare]
MIQSPESQRVPATVQSTPMVYDGRYFQSTSTVVPYYPSGVSSDYYNKPSPSLPTSPPSHQYHMNPIVDRNYGQPRHIGTLHEMDGAERDPLELSTGSVEEDNRIRDQGSVVSNAVQDPASRINRV